MHPIEGDELRTIRRYLDTRDDNLPWLFVSERQGKLTKFAVNYLVDRVAKEAGFLICIRIAYGIHVATH